MNKTDNVGIETQATFSRIPLGSAILVGEEENNIAALLGPRNNSDSL